MLAPALRDLLQRLDNAAQSARRPPVRLLAVGKTQPASAILEVAREWRLLQPDRAPAFGENYVQEALAKQAALALRQTQREPLPELEWHLIGHLQSNKAREAARAFDWVQTVDRLKLVAALAAHRPADRSPLNVLIQVNIDDEAGKHGCAAGEVDVLADAIGHEPSLRLRGLMAIPAPHPQVELRRAAFRAMRTLFDALAADHPQVDTLSMGMSEDIELAIEEGATMVRVGTALFGMRT